MSLKRFVAVLTGIALLVVALAGMGVYLAAWRSANTDRLEASRLAAQRAAQNVTNALGLVKGSMNGLARDPRLAAALASGDAGRLRDEEARLTAVVPGALLIRLLPESTATLDEVRAPRMGFADLQMVRQAVTELPPPAMHGINTPDVHLALARRLEGGGGVILASLAPQLLAPFMASESSVGALELRQAELSLHYQGDPALRDTPAAGEVIVSGTPWTLAYRDAGEPLLRHWWFLLIPLPGAALLIASVYRLRRRLIRAFRADQRNISRLAKDLMSGRALGNYPMHIAENGLMTQELARLKREAYEEGLEPPSAEFTSAGAPMAPKPVFPPQPPEPEEVDATAVAHPSIFRAYDIRGVVGETLTAETVFELGRAIGSEAHARGEQRVAIARDGRLSSAKLSQALAQGLQATGRNVIDLGLAPTPLLYFATHFLTGKSGVMVTGSHNPPQYNGLKIVLGGETLAEQAIQKLRERMLAGDYIHGTGKIETRNLIPDYIERVAEDMQLGQSMKIVMDCGNGVAGTIAPELMRTLGCDVVELYCEVDGHFPNHHPDPSKPENLAALIETVKREQADLGVAFDGDGDRLGVVDCNGKIIWPDRQMMLFAADVLSRQPGSDIIFDVKCSRHLPSHIVRNGGRPLMWKTGHSLLKAKLKETGAMLAGEMSGHICFQERWYGFDDAIYACARLVEILSGDPLTTAEVFAELPDSINTPELNVPLSEGENIAFVERVKAIAKFPEARITDIDGLRVDFIDGWGLVRASNTTPSLTLRFEADNEKALARIQGAFRDLLVRVKADIQLPF